MYVEPYGFRAVEDIILSIERREMHQEQAQKLNNSLKFWIESVMLGLFLHLFSQWKQFCSLQSRNVKCSYLLHLWVDLVKYFILQASERMVHFGWEWRIIPKNQIEMDLNEVCGIIEMRVSL